MRAHVLAHTVYLNQRGFFNVPHRANEAARLSDLRDLRILGTEAEPHFDAVCRLARTLFNVPIAVISFVAEEHQWFKAKCGLSVDSTSRDVAFCDQTIRSDAAFVIEDASTDSRFADNPLVMGAPHIRFYAGVPLSLRPGVRLGTLCIIDTLPRSFGAEDEQQLRDLSDIVVAHLRLHQAHRRAKVTARASAAELVQRRAVERLLVEREAHLRTAEEARIMAEAAACLGHWRIHFAERTVTWSNGIARIYGRNANLETLPLDAHLDFYHPDDRESVRARVEALITEADDPSPGGYAHCSRVLRPDGTVRHVRVNGAIERDAASRIVALHGVCIDMTDLICSEQELRTTADLLRLAQDAAGAGVWEWDIGARTVCLSSASARLHGLDAPGPDADASRLLSLDAWTAHVVPEDRSRLWSEVKAAVMALGSHTTEFRVRGPDNSGPHRWLQSYGRIVLDESTGRPTRMVGLHIDVTQRKQAEQQIAHLATHDPLTGLPNRLLFHDRLDQELARAKRHGGIFGVLACDLDRFKAVNDALGHPAGDKLLRTVADRLASVTGETDTIARLGGDEFAIILSGLDGPQSASLVAQRVIKAVGVAVAIDGETASVGVSVGIALGTAECSDADSLFKNADTALYRAKASGRNTFSFYEPGMDAAIAKQNRLERDLREAVRTGGLALHYQPIVRLADGEVSGFEALLRWSHPERGLISPADFIPLAEETGLIVPIGEWVLRTACWEAVGWPGDLRVAVNVSGVQFQRQGLEQSVIGALAASGLAPERLELEITESVLMEDSEATIACLRRLRTLGVRIALDDFGTGYSSLSYLRQFSFDKIKVDRSFIRDIADPDTAALVRAIVDIGSRRGATITAEGVELADQLAGVRREGCSEVQGYIFSKPLPASEASAFVTNHRSRNAA